MIEKIKNYIKNLVKKAKNLKYKKDISKTKKKLYIV
jgi:hypothetical protein